MTDIIFLGLVFLLLYPIFRAAFRFWRQVHGIRREFNRQFGGGARENEQGYSEPGSSRRYGFGRRKTKKAISHDVGEYVEFEEIKEERTVEDVTGDAADTLGSETEPAITDAEFEDIK